MLKGGAHNDLLMGEEDNDDLIGGPGHDVLMGGVGKDILLGDEGSIPTHDAADHGWGLLPDINRFDGSDVDADSLAAAFHALKRTG